MKWVSSVFKSAPKLKKMLGKKTAVIIGTLFLIFVFFISWTITSMIVGNEESTTEQTQVQKKNQQEIEKTPTSRKVVGIIILIALIVILSVSAYNNYETGKSWHDQKFWGWPVAITFFALIASNFLIFFLIPKLWGFLWSDSIFFWSLNIGILVFVAFKTKTDKDGKPIPAAQKAAIAFGLVLAIGLLTQMMRNPYWESVEWNRPGGDQKPSSNTTRSAANTYIPADVAIPIICGCESSGVPGKIQHYKPGTKTLLQNKEGSDAVGGCQIKTSLHEERAKEKGFDIKTEEGNIGYAKLLYNESTPHTKHWEGTSGNNTKWCWGPALAAWQYQNGGQAEFPMELATFEIPAENKWSQKVKSPLIDGTKIVWGRDDKTKGGKCEVMFDENSSRVFPITETHLEFNPVSFQFRCTEPVLMRVYVARK